MNKTINDLIRILLPKACRLLLILTLIAGLLMPQQVFAGGLTSNLSSIPQNLRSVNVTDSRIDLTWDDVNGAASYNVYRADESGGMFSQVNEEGPYNMLGTTDENTFTDSGLNSNTAYWYKVSGVKEVVEGSQSDSLNVTTLEPTIIGFSLDAYTVNEDELTLQISVTRSGNTSQSGSIHYTTEDMTALAGQDYTAATGTITFAGGEITRDITLTILDDNEMEETETLKLMLFDPSFGVVIGENDETIIDVDDNDSQVILSEDGEVVITTWHTSPQDKWLRKSDRFYNGTYSWAPVSDNKANYTFYSPAFNFKGSKTAILRFATWYDLENSYDHGIVEISEDDGNNWQQLKSYTGTSDWKIESIDLSSYCSVDNLRLRFRFQSDDSRLKQGWYIDDIALRTNNSIIPQPTGLAASEITPARITLSWEAVPAADSYYIYRSTDDLGPFAKIGSSNENTYSDIGLDPGKSYWYKVSALQDGQEGPQSQTLCVTTLDLAVIELVIDSIDVCEDNESLLIEVSRYGSYSNTVSAEYSTQDITAVQGQDYVETSGTITFGPDEISKSITIPLINDGLYEANETFCLTMLHPDDGAALGEKTQVTITISENDYMESTGTVVYQTFEGGFFGIIGDDGQKYRPVSQPRKIKDGDFVRFGWIDAESGHGYQMWGKPIRIITLEVIDKQPDIPGQDLPGDDPPKDDPAEPVIPNPGIHNKAIIQFSKQSYSANESSPKIVITVKRSGNHEYPCRVDYETIHVTAGEKQDYEGV